MVTVPFEVAVHVMSKLLPLRSRLAWSFLQDGRVHLRIDGGSGRRSDDGVAGRADGQVWLGVGAGKGSQEGENGNGDLDHCELLLRISLRGA